MNVTVNARKSKLMKLLIDVCMNCNLDFTTKVIMDMHPIEGIFLMMNYAARKSMDSNALNSILETEIHSELTWENAASPISRKQELRFDAPRNQGLSPDSRRETQKLTIWRNDACELNRGTWRGQLWHRVSEIFM
jgi:hypothetical protein